MSNDPSTPGATSPGPWRWIGEDDNWRLVDEQTADVLVAVANLHGEEVDIRADDASARALIASAPDLRDERDRLAAYLAEAADLLRAMDGSEPTSVWFAKVARFLSSIETARRTVTLPMPPGKCG